MVGNFVLRRRVSEAVKRNSRTYNRRYTSPNENFEYGYPHSNALFNIDSSKAQYFATNVSFVSKEPLRQPITSDVTYDVGAPMVYIGEYTDANSLHCAIRRRFIVSTNYHPNETPAPVATVDTQET